MKKYPIRQLIDSGAWFRCEGKEYGSRDRIVSFRIRFNSFRIVDASEIDHPEWIGFSVEEGRVWLLSISAVNTGKEGFAGGTIREMFLIVDQDECIFPHKYGNVFFQIQSEFCKSAKTNRFTSSFLPKMIAEGAITFLLPEEESQQYSLALNKDFTMDEL